MHERTGNDRRQPWEIDAANIDTEKAVDDLSKKQAETDKRNADIDAWIAAGGTAISSSFDEWLEQQEQSSEE